MTDAPFTVATWGGTKEDLPANLKANVIKVDPSLPKGSLTYHTIPRDKVSEYMASQGFHHDDKNLIRSSMVRVLILNTAFPPPEDVSTDGVYAVIHDPFAPKQSHRFQLIDENSLHEFAASLSKTKKEDLRSGTWNEETNTVQIDTAVDQAPPTNPNYSCLLQSIRICSFCATVAQAHQTLKKCSACKTTQYCNPICQRAHWKAVHRQECAGSNGKNKKKRKKKPNAKIQMELSPGDASTAPTVKMETGSAAKSVVVRHTGDDTPVANPSDDNWPVSKLVLDVMFNNDTLLSYYQGRLGNFQESLTPAILLGAKNFKEAVIQTRHHKTTQKAKDERKVVLGTHLLKAIPNYLRLVLFAHNASQELQKMGRQKKKSKKEMRANLGILVVELPMHRMIEHCDGTEIVAVHYLKRKQFKALCALEDSAIPQKRQKIKGKSSANFVKERWKRQKADIDKSSKNGTMIPVVLRFNTKAYDQPATFPTRLSFGMQYGDGTVNGFDQCLAQLSGNFDNLLAVGRMAGAQTFLIDLSTGVVDGLDFDPKSFNLHLQVLPESASRSLGNKDGGSKKKNAPTVASTSTPLKKYEEECPVCLDTLPVDARTLNVSNDM